MSGRIIAFGLAGFLAVAAGLFAVFYYALDSADQYDPTAQGLIPADSVPDELQARAEAQ